MELEYNTQLEPLVIKEYGRNVQRMVRHAITIEDKEERNLAVKGIIQVMGLINPDDKKGNDHEQKLWDHLHIMADFKLDVDSPYDPPLAEKEMDKVASKPGYPKGRIRYRHYGKVIQQMIEVAKNEEDEERKEKMKNYLGAYMKLAFKQWSEQKMSDEVIMMNIKDMSDGLIDMENIVDITESVQLNSVSNAKMSTSTPPNRRKKTKKKKRR